MKKIKYYIFIFVLFFINIINIKAASCVIGATAPSSVVVGKTFSVTVTVSSNEPIGSWNYTLDYNSSYVKLNSGSLHIVDYGNGSKKSASYTYSFTALKSGTTEFKPTNASVIDFNSENECLSYTKKASITMKTQQEIEASYSKNNNLSQLEIEGSELSPAFNVDVLEYSAVMPPDTKTVNIKATAQDNTAHIEGAGEKEVLDGLNKIEVIVTAQHGEKKTYVINLTVEELDPIEVKLNSKKYTVVRKNAQIENIPLGFEENTININEQSITCYKSEILKMILVVLKDEEGNKDLFIYDEKTKKYETFNTVKGDFSNLLIVKGKNKSFLKYFVKTKFKYQGKEIEGYKLKNVSNEKFYLVYAKNLQNGKEGYYVYNSDDNTFQLFNEDILKVNDKKIEYMNYIIYFLSGIIVLIFIIKIFSKNKRNNKKNNDFGDLNKAKDEDKLKVEKVNNDDYEVIKKSKKQKLEEIKEAKRKLDSKKKSYKTLFDDEDE